ncbi:MAG: STAS domain-containing protein [Maribacter sp.]
MSIQILENNGVFHVDGILDSQNAQVLNTYISKVINTTQHLILNLERVVEFDSKAAFMLLRIFINAVHSNTKFAVIGISNKKLIQVLQETETIHIWSQSKILK